jgi:hypothetical protein
VARYSEGSESCALHNSLRSGSKPVDGREGYIYLLDARWERVVCDIGADSRLQLVFKIWCSIHVENGDAKVPSAEDWRYACFCY